MQQFLKQINKKATKKRVLSKLEYLKMNFGTISYNDYMNLKTDSDVLNMLKSDNFLNALKQNDIDKKTLLDFLPSYTRSIVIPPSGTIPKNAMDLKLLNAIEKKEELISFEKAKDIYHQWLLTGISQLSGEERRIIIDKYIFRLPDKLIMEKNDVSDRTLSRVLNQAYWNLAILWNLEVKK